MKGLFLCALAGVPSLIKASWEGENEFCDEYEKVQEQCRADTNRKRRAAGLEPLDYTSIYETINSQDYQKNARIRNKRVITVTDDQILEDPRRKWLDAYEKPITYMLIDDDESRKSVDNLNVFRSIIIEAFDIWADETNLRFMEVKSEEVAEIKIQFFPEGQKHNEEEYCKEFEEFRNDVLDGEDGNFISAETMLAHGNLPFGHGWDDKGERYQDVPAGDLHFSANLNWDTTTDDDSTYNLFSVAIHEIGHTIGVPHNGACEESLMYYRYTDTLKQQTVRTAKLHEADKLYIKCLYGEREPLWKRREFRITVSLAGTFIGVLVIYQILEHYFEFIPHNENWMTVKRPQRGLLTTFTTNMKKFGTAARMRAGKTFSRGQNKKMTTDSNLPHLNEVNSETHNNKDIPRGFSKYGGGVSVMEGEESLSDDDFESTPTSKKTTPRASRFRSTVHAVFSSKHTAKRTRSKLNKGTGDRNTKRKNQRKVNEEQGNSTIMSSPMAPTRTVGFAGVSTINEELSE